MIFNKLCKTLIALTFFASFAFPLTTAFARADLENPRLAVNKSKIYSISIKPDSPTGKSNYILKIFGDERANQQIASAIRPLSGKIIDVDIYDVDKDGQEELVIKMLETVSTNSRVRLDIFELEEKKLGWLEDFAPIASLVNLFSRLHINP